MYLDSNDIRERIKNTLMDVLGIEFIETDEPNILEARMHVVRDISQTMGVLHGGATIALAESVAGVGSNILCNEDEKCFGMQISASHISSARIGDTVRAIGTIIHKGRTTHVWDISILSEDTGRLVSSIKVTNAVVKDKK